MEVKDQSPQLFDLQRYKLFFFTVIIEHPVVENH